ncbi:MAG: DUF2934 domain-containing protein [Verrucomicrobiota bacterium]
MKKSQNNHKEHSHNECNPDPQEIQRRAYQLYLERGGDSGHDSEDWLKAECELKEVGQVAMSL